MTREQFGALQNLIEAMIADKISDAFGRDGLHEAIRLSEAEKDARALLITEGEG